MFHIVLIQPEIPPNTGNIIRLAANTGATLHLVKPLGFELSARAVRRAGLDYEELAPVRVHSSLEACLEALAGALTIPMRPGNRSLNLSNAVALVIYEAWRQNGFAGAQSATL